MSKERGKALFDEAYKIINGERQDDYGKPEASFAFIARLWTHYIEEYCCFKNSNNSFRCIDRVNVAMMMILLKVARGTKHDNFVDICGYAALADVLASTNPLFDDIEDDNPEGEENDNPEQ